MNDRQQAFIDFVLVQYVKQGVDELDQEKLGPLLRLKYGKVVDGLNSLGDANDVRLLFLGMQQQLYQLTLQHVAR